VGDDVAPSTGRRGLLLACASIWLTYVCIFSVPPLISTFVDDVGYSHAEAGALMAAFTLAYCVGSLPAGRLADRYGAARVMAAGVLVAGAGSALGATTDVLAPLLVTRAVVGLGDALVWTAGVIYVVQVLPPARRIAGVGWFTGALSAGIASGFLFTPVLEDALGWRGILALYGALALAGGAAVFAAVRRDGHAAPAGPAVPVASVLRERRLLAVSGALFLGMAAAYGPLTWIPSFMDEVGGFSDAQRGVAGMLMAFAAIPGGIVAGLVAGRTGRPAETYAACLVLCLPVAILAVGAEDRYVVVTVIAALSAAGSTGAVTPLFAVVGSLVRSEAAGTAAGVATTIGIAGTVVASYGGGLLVSYGGGYEAAFAVFAGVALAGILIGAPAARRALATGGGAGAGAGAPGAAEPSRVP
jgi:predicted MFS family arabinose efflux permease